MKICDRVHIVASGEAGFSISNPYDCTVYLIDGHTECALIDAGAGINPEEILRHIAEAGIKPEKITKILLTHGHGDHSGGAYALSRACSAEVYAMEAAAAYVSEGNTKALSLSEAIKAGVYGKDYQYHACPVRPIRDRDIIQVGDLMLQALSTDGHCSGHACYLMEADGKKYLFSGDSIFFGGKISLQAIWDCDLMKYVKTIERLEEIHPDVFLPSHGCISLSRGWIHIDKAAAVIKKLGIPQNVIGD